MKRTKNVVATVGASVVAAVLMWSSFAIAAETNPLHPSYYLERLKDVKGVDDGKLSKSEFMKFHEQQWGKMVGHRDMPIADHKNPLSPHYGKEPVEQMDKNKDGIISAEEYMKFHEAHWDEWKAKGLVDSQGYVDRNNPRLPSYKP
jgi:EF hand